MAEKHTTLSQMKKTALRTKIEVLSLLINALESGQVAKTITLPVTNWSGSVQTIKDPFMLSDSKYWYFVCGDADCFTLYSEAGVKADNITANGEMTFRCEVTPDEDLTVNIIRLDVETEEETTDEQQP